MKIKIPKNQTLWVSYYDSKGNPVKIITSDLLRSKYYLYKITGEKGEKLEKVKTAESPAEFENEVGKV
jgi:hypothetical protein